MIERNQCIAEGRMTTVKDPPAGHTGWRVMVAVPTKTVLPAEGEAFNCWVKYRNGKAEGVPVKQSGGTFTAKYGDLEGRDCVYAEMEANWGSAEPPQRSKDGPGRSLGAVVAEQKVIVKRQNTELLALAGRLTKLELLVRQMASRTTAELVALADRVTKLENAAPLGPVPEPTTTEDLVAETMETFPGAELVEPPDTDTDKEEEPF